jgi:CRISPR type III-associated protein (TIGR04423 family)
MCKIEKSTYEGYLWYSDQKKPKIYDNKVMEFNFDDNANPFVVEGFLHDGKTSYSIKYVDGKHIIAKFDLNNLPTNFTEQTFIPSFKEVAGLTFQQYWRPETDENCLGMEVLKPAEFVFVGFKNKEV